MKLATIADPASGKPVVVLRDGPQCATLAATCAGAGLDAPATMLALVERCETDPAFLGALRAALARTPQTDVAGARFCPPLLRPSKILGVAFNNRNLMKTAHRDPGVPNFFLKPPSCLIGHGDAIRVDPAWGAVIPEPEICAVIGRRSKNLTDETALDAVFGYLIHNDVTSHGLKFGKDSIAVTYPPELAHAEFYQWRNLHGDQDRDVFYVYHTRSKGADTFGPMGPWITTRDEIADPDAIAVVGRLDGEVFTRDSTANYRFPIRACIAEASRYFTLEPGDLISFGTTGTGEGRFPHGHKSVLLNKITGRISIEAEGLGTLENDVVHFTSDT